MRARSFPVSRPADCTGRVWSSGFCYRRTEAPGERGQSLRKNGSEPPAAAHRNIDT
ncbi:hypothetical protein BCEP4_120022 [Burkholderia cepacia]|nr:hypothetical protein BCEP4_120022 [Burkholderia cepacia]